MTAQSAADRIRWGILTLPVAFIFLLTSVFLRGDLIDPTTEIGAYAALASSVSFSLSNVVYTIGIILLLFGFLALYAFLANGRAAPWAFAAMILGVVGLVASAMWAASDSVDSIGGKLYLEGQQAFLEERYDSFLWIDVFFAVAGRGMFLGGAIAFGIAIWRSALPQGAAILWIASILLFPTSQLGMWVEALTFGLVTISSVWIARAVWRQPSAEVAEAGAEPRVQ